jgi:hypothetical protein
MPIDNTKNKPMCGPAYGSPVWLEQREKEMRKEIALENLKKGREAKAKKDAEKKTKKEAEVKAKVAKTEVKVEKTNPIEEK